MKRLGKREALLSFILPASFYTVLATLIGYVFWPYFYWVKNEVLISIALIGMWRYSLLVINYIRAAIYGFYYYSKVKKKISLLDEDDKYPEHIYFIIPSYKEEPWVSMEVFQSIFADLNNIPSSATLFVSTGSDKDDQVIRSIYDSHPLKDKVSLVFQRQKDGKRIAMGHALRALARRYNRRDPEENSVTVFMDGDSYIPFDTLRKCIPVFNTEKDVGAVTTNEVAYIDTKSRWYKDWFNLKFGQRHVLFQSQSLSRKVLTLTGRFSVFRTNIIVEEDFISMIENDVIIDPSYGKFRFLMGDDKSSWYYLMKNGWNMLYIPDATIYSLESRDGNFLEVSQSLPYRWYGNTLRNNKRARALKGQPLFIQYLFWDQIFLMWTSLVGIVGAVFLAIFVNFVYLPIYIAWVIYVRVLQMLVITLTGHSVSMRTIPLMLYTQWIGSLIKIKAYFHLSDQKWSKGGTEVQTADSNIAPLRYKYARYFSTLRMYFFFALFLFAMLTLNNSLFSLPSTKLFADNKPDNLVYFNAITDDGKDDGKSLNKLIKNVKDGAIISLPEGVLDIYTPIHIRRSNITLRGKNTVLLSHLHNNEESVILVEGKKKQFVGLTQESMYDKIRISVKQLEQIKKNDLLLIEQENDKPYVQKHMKSEVWYKQYPLLRTEIVQAVKVQKPDIYFAYKSMSEIDKGAKIYKLDMIKNVHIQNVTIDSSMSSSSYKHVYENIDKSRFIDGIKFKYANACSLSNVKIFNSGSNPLTFERSYLCRGRDIDIDGAVNKGKKGNGYLRFNKTFRTTLENVKVKNIRHVVFQWASAYNSIENIYTEVDINFHGGASHHNHIENIEFNVDRDKHKWAEVYITPKDASWAPPDYNNNTVKKAVGIKK